MPRFFLHVHDGRPMPDLEGSEFASLAEVNQAVRLSLIEMMADASLERNVINLKIEVRDEHGRLVVGGQVDYTLNVVSNLDDPSDDRRH